jgi:hypothetical protein
MARFEVTHNRAGINTANSPMWQFKTAASSRARIFEIALSVAGTVAPTNGPGWRLVRAATVGTSSATVTAEEQDPGGGAATAVLDTTWTTPPTFAAVNMRLYQTPNTLGSGIVWTWPDHRPLIVPLSSGVVIVNVNPAGAALGTFNCSIVYEE